MFFGGGPQKSHIEEANRHLLALTSKIEELEKLVQTRDEELKKKEEDFATAMQEIHVKRQLELQDLNQLIYKQNLELNRLKQEASSRDSELTVLRKRCRMFDEVLRYKATMAKLVITLEQAEQFASHTGYARNYPRGNTKSYDNDLIHTEPAPPRMIMDREPDGVQFDESQLIDEVAHTYAKAVESRAPKLAELADKSICS